MTEEQYNMTFGEWLNATQDAGLTLGEYGEILYFDPRKQELTERYHDLWLAEVREYRLRQKNMAVTGALEALKKAGVNAVLSSYQNGHIKAKSKRGVALSYYATTGTIAGYQGTSVEGLDEFIRLCKG